MKLIPRICIMVAALLLRVGVASAQTLGEWEPPPGISGLTSPQWGYQASHFSNEIAGDCFGNCGAGCSGQLFGGADAPCGNRSEWVRVLSGGPSYSGYWAEANCIATGVKEIRGYSEYAYSGHWVYRGTSSAACVLHDAHCDGGYFDCFFSLPGILSTHPDFCSGAHDRDWAGSEKIMPAYVLISSDLFDDWTCQ